MNVLTYAVDAPGETIQERVIALANHLRLITDIETDARRKAEEIREELVKLKPDFSNCEDDEL
jgi:hypothetical protein